MGKVIVVVGGQFGSEGKGAIAGYLSRPSSHPFMAIRVGGSNAGHSVYDASGKRYAFRALPVAAVVNHDAWLGIAAGSEVDLSILEREAHEAGVVKERLLLDPQATVIEDHNYRAENNSDLVKRIGSTGKGIGAARSERIWRRAMTVGKTPPRDREPWTIRKVLTQARTILAAGGTVLIEGVQGWGLGLHAGFYPYCTSIDCRAIDFMAMAGIDPWDAGVDQLEIWVVVRTFPIRVAGDSGPLEFETSWEALGQRSDGYIKQEVTTVTQKVRRVGEWDPQLVRDAVAANGGRRHVQIALTMFDYLYPKAYGATRMEELPGRNAHGVSPTQALQNLEADIGVPVRLLGTGPDTLIDRREW